MREFDALRALPAAVPRVAAGRDIAARIVASRRGPEFFDGDRRFGYGGYVDDGRWGPVAKDMIADYGLSRSDTVLQLQCEKGFLLAQLRARGISAWGTETSPYALSLARIVVGREAIFAPPVSLPFQNQAFNLVIAIGVVYALTLEGAVTCLREISRVARGKSFVTLGAYETSEDLERLRRWSLLGCTLLRREEWMEVMQHAGYDGDYKFVTAGTLGLTA